MWLLEKSHRSLNKLDLKESLLWDEGTEDRGLSVPLADNAIVDAISKWLDNSLPVKVSRSA